MKSAGAKGVFCGLGFCKVWLLIRFSKVWGFLVFVVWFLGAIFGSSLSLSCVSFVFFHQTDVLAEKD